MRLLPIRNRVSHMTMQNGVSVGSQKMLAPEFRYNPSASAVKHFSVTNKLWSYLSQKTAHSVVNSIKSPLLYGLEYFVDKWNKVLSVTAAQPLNILITAGGTKEPIDDVRYITNFSSGALGRAFANLAAWRGHHVVLLAPQEIERTTGQLHRNVEHRPFRSTASLKDEITKAARERKWDLVLQSAAISDFTPAKTTQGKIRSREAGDEINIPLVKTPKLLASFREWFGEGAFLVGFKLLSGMSDEERLQIAQDQISSYGTDLCFENDLTQVSRYSHKARLVTKAGSVISVPIGRKEEVAMAVFNYLEKVSRG